MDTLTGARVSPANSGDGAASLTLVSRAGMNLATISTPTSEKPAPINTARPSASVNADFAAVARASASSGGSDAAS